MIHEAYLASFLSSPITASFSRNIYFDREERFVPRYLLSHNLLLNEKISIALEIATIEHNSI